MRRGEVWLINLDPTMAAKGRAAIASCCDEQGHGRVALGYRPGQLIASRASPPRAPA